MMESFNCSIVMSQTHVNKNCSPWNTDSIKLLMKFRHEALSEFKKCISDESWEYYKHLGHYLTAAIENAENLIFVKEFAQIFPKITGKC